MTDKYSDLKKAAEVANDDSGGAPWAYESHGDTGEFGVGVLEDAQGNPVQGLQISGEMLVVDPVAPEVSSDAYAKFIALANPATVLALLADLEGFMQGADVEAREADAGRKEIKRLMAVIESAKVELNDQANTLYERRIKIGQLKAEAESLRKDAERYRWLREQEALEGGIAIFPVGLWVKPAMLCTTPFDSAEMTDDVVDAAMTKEPQS